jgi:hypothetical protein
MAFVQQLRIISRPDERPAHRIHHVGTIAVRGHWHRWRRVQLRQPLSSHAGGARRDGHDHPPVTGRFVQA